MSEEMSQFSITPKPEKIIRDERRNKKENLSFIFSGELENDHENKGKAKKKLVISDEVANIAVGTLYFNELGNSFEIKEVVRNHEYSGNEVGLNLYKELIRIAKSRGLESIKSDSVVQGGANAIWKKMLDEGYVVIVNAKVKEKFAEFLRVYNEGKYYKDFLEVPIGENVFELRLNNEYPGLDKST